MISILHMFVYNWNCCQKVQCCFPCSDEASDHDEVPDEASDAVDEDDDPSVPGK